ncbi:hypothetical protein KBD59_04240 [Candidatus Gracilibacteria bacterium]|nr:hypothetical protein [Candidatus Gracilibacteria bacterium]
MGIETRPIKTAHVARDVRPMLPFSFAQALKNATSRGTSERIQAAFRAIDSNPTMPNLPDQRLSSSTLDAAEDAAANLLPPETDDDASILAAITDRRVGTVALLNKVLAMYEKNQHGPTVLNNLAVLGGRVPTSQSRYPLNKLAWDRNTATGIPSRKQILERRATNLDEVELQSKILILRERILDYSKMDFCGNLYDNVNLATGRVTASSDNNMEKLALEERLLRFAVEKMKLGAGNKDAISDLNTMITSIMTAEDIQGLDLQEA